MDPFSVHYHHKTEQKLYTANWQSLFETQTKQSVPVLVQVVVSI